MPDTYLYDGKVVLRFDPKRHRYTVLDTERNGDEEFKVPSVTTVLGVISKGDALTQWAANQVAVAVEQKLLLNCVCEDVCVCEYTPDQVRALVEECRNAFKRKKQEAADIGTEAHARIEGILNTQLANLGVESDSALPVYESSGVLDTTPSETLVQNCVDAASEWLRSNEVVPILAERRIYSRRYKFSGTADLIAKVRGKLALVDWKSSKGLYREYEFQTAAYCQAYYEETGQKIETRWLIRLGKEDGAFEPKELTNLRGDTAAFLAALRLHRALQK